MRRFCFGPNASMQEHYHGAWVTWEDAEAEIEKARKEGERDGRIEMLHAAQRAGGERNPFDFTPSDVDLLTAEARADERERIVKELRDYQKSWFAPRFDELVNRIESGEARGEPKPEEDAENWKGFKREFDRVMAKGFRKSPKIDRLDITAVQCEYYPSTTLFRLVASINALIDAENARRE